VEVLGIDRGDDDQRDEVVDHDEREHERPQAVGEARSDERE
jgi:hypothetical protein